MKLQDDHNALMSRGKRGKGPLSLRGQTFFPFLLACIKLGIVASFSSPPPCICSVNRLLPSSSFLAGLHRRALLPARAKSACVCRLEMGIFDFLKPVDVRDSAVQQQAQDWESLTDPASGKPYFWNKATGETSWVKPTDDRPNLVNR
jgi:hypothetical protein